MSKASKSLTCMQLLLQCTHAGYEVMFQADTISRNMTTVEIWKRDAPQFHATAKYLGHYHLGTPDGTEKDLLKAIEMFLGRLRDGEIKGD